jgi:5-methylcytosine-specific restriction protein B
MHPTEEPVKSVLGRYLAANHISDGREALLAELNKRMGEKGRDLQIGPSYLMRAEIRTDADIDRVWRYDILPLIEEHYYGQMDRSTVRATFGVEALRRAVAGASDSGDDGLGEVLGGVGVGGEGPGALDDIEGEPLE